MRILLTGGAGFIGSRIVDQLLNNGHEVMLVLRVSSDTRRIGGLLSKVQVVHSALADLADRQAELQAFAPESCIHVAWYAEPGKYLDSTLNFESLASTLALLNLLKEIGCHALVMAGTCAEYREQEQAMLEDSPTNPQTIYAEAKLSAMKLARQFAKLNDMQIAWGRIFLLYGPGEDRRRAIPAITGRLSRGESFDATEGTQSRDFLHVDDVAAGFVTLCESKASGIFNICSGEARTMRSVFEAIQSILGLSGKIRFGKVQMRAWETPVIVGDNRKLRELGWQPKYTFEEGLRNMMTVEGYLKI